MILRYEKARPGVKTPVRSNPSDAGLDVFYCPEHDKGAIFIGPTSTAKLPTGLRFEVPHGYMLEVKNRSSMAAKKQLLVGACVIDSGYDGEIFVNLHNVGKQTHWFSDGDKVAQGVLIPVNLCEVVEVSDPDELNKDSTRGDGALGSTGSR